MNRTDKTRSKVQNIRKTHLTGRVYHFAYSNEGTACGVGRAAELGEVLWFACHKRNYVDTDSILHLVAMGECKLIEGVVVAHPDWEEKWQQDRL